MTAWSQLRTDTTTVEVVLPQALLAAPTVDARPIAGITALLGEHPVWSQAHGGLLWVDIDAGRLWRTTADGATTEIFSGAGALGAGLPTAAATYLLSQEGLLSLGIDGGVQGLASGPPAGLRFNDAGLGPDQQVWAGVLPLQDPAPGEQPDGRLWRLAPDGAWCEVFDGMGCPNGIVWSADQRTILCCESDSRQIASADYDPTTGEATGWRVAWQFSGEGEWVPDGLELLPDGRLWVAFWGLGCAVRFRTDGQVDLVVRTSDERTTSVATDPSGRVWVTTASGLCRVEQPL